MGYTTQKKDAAWHLATIVDELNLLSDMYFGVSNEADKAFKDVSTAFNRLAKIIDALSNGDTCIGRGEQHVRILHT